MTIEFTSGGILFTEAAQGSTASRGSSTSVGNKFIARSGDPTACAEAYVAKIDGDGLDAGDFDVTADFIGDRAGGGFCLVTVNRKVRQLASLSFATTGGTLHLNQSYGTRASYPAPGRTAPNYQGAIGVDGSTVNGVDVTVPAFNFSLRRRFKFVSTAYLAQVLSLTGKVNSATWEVFAAGELLFLGAEGAEDDENYVDMTYQFAARPNQTGLTIGGINGITKRGWDYLWVKHEEKVVADLVLTVPAAVYIEQVYPEGNLSTLGISLGLGGGL